MTHAILTFPMARIDLDRRWVEPLDGSPERLTTLEAKLLLYLARNADRVVSRDELLAEVWGYAPTTVSRACDTTVRRLRTKIEQNPSEPECLLTVHGLGYRLILSGNAEPAPVVAAMSPRRTLALSDRTVDLDRARVDGPSGSVALTTNEIAVIELLAASAGRSVDREVLLRRIWGSSAGRPLDHAVGRLRRKLERDPARPQLLVTTTTGYRLDLDGASAPRSPARAGNLSAEVDRRLGREVELAALLARLDAGDRLVVLVGPGGVGKTRLAAAAARALEGRGRPAWWFDLTGVDRAEQAVAVVARQLRVATVGGDPEIQVTRALAALGPAVIVFDNLDELGGSEAALITRLVAAAPDGVFLATSRLLLRLQGERRFEVGPMSEADAVALFLDRAIRPPEPSEQAEVVALVTELEGMPLAIELAAASTRLLPVAEIRRRSRDRLLASGDRNRTERYRSLRASLDGSWDLLSPWARSALARLSVFRGGFTIDAAERVLDLAEWPEAAWILDVIEELVDASLVRVHPDGTRFGLLQVVQRYAAEHLPDAVRAEVEERHGAWFATLGTPAALAAADGPDEVELRRALKADLDNLLAASERAIGRGDAAVAGAAACAAWTVLDLTGPVRTAAELLARVAAMAGAEARVDTEAGQAFLRMGALDRAEVHFRRALATDPRARLGLAEVLDSRDAPSASPEDEAALVEGVLARARADGDRALECRALLAHSRQQRRRLENDAAVHTAETALRIAVGLGARRLTALSERRLSKLNAALGDLDASHARLSRALTAAVDVGDRVLEALVLSDLGSRVDRRGPMPEGREHLRAALELQRDIGDRMGETLTLGNLGRVESLLGNHEEAEQYFHDALALARTIGVFELELGNLGNLALHTKQRGRLAEAEPRLLEAIALARRHGFPRGEAVGCSNLGSLYATMGRLPEARAALERALVLHQRAGNQQARAVTLGNLGMLTGELGDWKQARALVLEALEISREAGDLRAQDGWSHQLALFSVRDGDPAAARALVARAIRGHRAASDRINLGRALLVQVEVEHAEGRLEEARACLAEAEALLERAEARRRAEVRALPGLIPDGS